MPLSHVPVPRVALGEPRTSGPLTVTDLLLLDNLDPADYDLASDGLEDGSVSVIELPGGGAVPLVRVVNRRPKPVLIVDGDHFIGARQNRVSNLTVLVPAQCTLDVPVVCAERGRWSSQYGAFVASAQVQFARSRSLKMDDVSRSLAQDGVAYADQVRVWDEIHAKARNLGVVAPTEAMADVVEGVRGRLDSLCGPLDEPPDGAGAVFQIGERLLGVELFDSAATFRKVYHKLLRSFGMDAIDSCFKGGVAADIRALVSSLGRRTWQPYQAVGLGLMSRLDDSGLVGAALEWSHRVVHLSVLARA
jgi:hypothetical protein